MGELIKITGDIITWCNTNEGFATLLLSALTLLTSIIAIIVSINTARLPYKKKLLITAGSYIGETEHGFFVTATNVGSRQVKISNIGFKIRNKVLINAFTISKSQIMLSPGDTTTQYYPINDFKQSVRAINVSNFTKVYAFAEDTENKVYKKYFIRVSNFLKI